MIGRERIKMTWRGRPSGALMVALGLFAAAPAAAQTSSRYEFFQAVRKGDAATVIETLRTPGTTMANAREADGGRTALHIVTEQREPGWINLLQQNGADVNARDDEGDTPLLIAAGLKWADGVRLLTHYGADVNLANRSGETPLIRAVQRRDADTVRLLLQVGADPDQADNIAGLSARDYAERDRRAGYLLQLIEETATGRENVMGPTR